MALGAPSMLAALLALAKGGAPASTDPIPIPIWVEFDAPAGCSSADAFYAGVAARSGRTRRAAPGEEALRLGIRVTRVGGKVHGELRWLDGRSEVETRRVEGVRCDEVVEVLSLTAALALGPTARVGPLPPAAPPPSTGASRSPAPPPSGPPVAGPAPPPPPVPPEPSTPAPAPDLRRAAEPPADHGNRPGARARFELSVGAEAIAARVLAPTVSFGGGLSVRLARQRRGGRAPSVALSGAYLANDPWRPDDEVVVHWTALGVTVCPGWGIFAPHLGIDFCAQAVGGWLRVTDRAVTVSTSAGRFWGSVGATARLGIPLGGRFSLEAQASLGVPFVERRFITSTPEATVGTTPSVVLAGGIGVARIF